MVEDQLNRMMRNAEAQMQQMFGGMKLGAEELQGLRENARPNAERQVRGGLLLVEVSKAANVEVNDEDIDKEIAQILSQAGRNAAMLEARFKEPQERNNIRFSASRTRQSSGLSTTRYALNQKPKKAPQSKPLSYF